MTVLEIIYSSVGRKLCGTFRNDELWRRKEKVNMGQVQDFQLGRLSVPFIDSGTIEGKAGFTGERLACSTGVL